MNYVLFPLLNSITSEDSNIIPRKEIINAFNLLIYSQLGWGIKQRQKSEEEKIWKKEEERDAKKERCSWQSFEVKLLFGKGNHRNQQHGLTIRFIKSTILNLDV